MSLTVYRNSSAALSTSPYSINSLNSSSSLQSRINLPVKGALLTDKTTAFLEEVNSFSHSLNSGDYTVSFPQEELKELVQRALEIAQFKGIGESERLELQSIEWALSDLISGFERVCQGRSDLFVEEREQIQNILAPLMGITFQRSLSSSNLLSRVWQAVGGYLFSDPEKELQNRIERLQSQIQKASFTYKNDPSLTAALAADAQKYREEPYEMPEWTKRVISTTFTLLQLGQNIATEVSKPPLFSQNKAPVKRNQIDKEEAFLGTYLQDKLYEVRGLSEKELSRFAKKYPAATPYLRFFRDHPNQLPDIASIRDQIRSSTGFSETPPTLSMAPKQSVGAIPKKSDLLAQAPKKGDVVHPAQLVTSIGSTTYPALPSAPSKEPQNLFSESMEERAQKEALEAAVQAVFSPDVNGRGEGAERFKKLIDKGYGVEKALQTATQAFTSSDSIVRGEGAVVFQMLIDKGYGIQQVLQLAIEAFTSPDSSVRWEGAGLLRQLIDKGYGMEQALQVAIKAFSHPDPYVANQGMLTVMTLINKGYGLKEALEAATKAFLSPDLNIRSRASMLFIELRSLFRGLPCQKWSEMEENLQALTQAFLNRNTGAPTERLVFPQDDLEKISQDFIDGAGFYLYGALFRPYPDLPKTRGGPLEDEIEKGYGVEQTLQAATEASVVSLEPSVDIQWEIRSLFLEAIDQGCGVKEALEAARQAVFFSRDHNVRLEGRKLFEKLIDKGYGEEEVLKAITESIFSQDLNAQETGKLLSQKLMKAESMNSVANLAPRRKKLSFDPRFVGN